ncbi:MAG TPA: hypothetical protein VK154_03915 [Chitinophagales bacterium]|nr:hypothetical protein [Chitinophagales bacterium]
MQGFNTVLLLVLLLFGLNAQAQDKQYLKWGKYQWEITTRIDSFVTDNEVSSWPVRDTSLLVCQTVWSFADTLLAYHEVDFILLDTFMEYHAKYLEEWQIVRKSEKSLSANVDGGKVKVDEFKRILQDSISFLPVLDDRVSYALVCILSGSTYRTELWNFNKGGALSGWCLSDFKGKNNFNALGLKAGDTVVVALYYGSGKQTNHNCEIRGSVLFEII